ncbi:sensor domain-containing diguanylate cyclase [Grimontia kaedaensis]|uniref:diguanylate cyclase n=1 Tax=Grimontia kaedaensis TaxID=2872157 RepID=A0ABY4WYV7_9GAMM|nr:sensor domain-containing diguanylate cyclase [Grimontia kaedaensis]USH04167.1 sensor domain-containing diguanylate cyclase [Grimontia kaedaensis]
MHLLRLCRFVCSVVVFVLGISQSVALAETDKDTIIVTNSHSWKPFAFSENGIAKGVLVDYWKLFGEINNTPVEFALSDWNDSLVAMQEGGRKVHAGLLYSESRDEYLDYVFPLFEISTTLYVVNDAEELKTQGVVPGMVVGVVRGGFEEEYLKNRYPLVATMGFDNNAALIQAARNGKIKRMLVDTQVATYYLLQQDRPLGFVPIERMYKKMLYAAVPAGNELLQREIESGIKNIPPHEIDRIKQKWLNTSRTTKIPSWLWPLVGSVLLLGTASYIILLKKAVRRKTRALKALNSKLEEYAFTDSLTGLMNRRGLDRVFASKRVKSMLKRGQLGVLMLDVDHFKQINDKYGHSKGDEVLNNLGRVLSNYLREAVAISRLGGEEICLLVSAEALHDLEVNADYVRSFIVPQASQEGIGLTVTASVGALLVDKDGKETSLEALLHHADRLMYQAKEAGRNRVMLGSLSSQQHHRYPSQVSA